MSELLKDRVDGGGEEPVLLTPGAEERRATDAAMAFLRGKDVDIRRFTHARASLGEDGWEVVLMEASDKPHFGGFEYSLTLRPSGLEVVRWSKMQ